MASMASSQVVQSDSPTTPSSTRDAPVGSTDHSSPPDLIPSQSAPISLVPTASKVVMIDEKQLVDEQMSELSFDGGDDASQETSQDSNHEKASQTGGKLKVETKQTLGGLSEINGILLELHESYDKQNRVLREEMEMQARELAMLRAQCTATPLSEPGDLDRDAADIQRENLLLRQQLAEGAAREKTAQDAYQKLLSERDESRSREQSAFALEVVFRLARELAQAKRSCESERKKKRTLQKENAQLRISQSGIGAVEEKCNSLADELTTLRQDTRRTEQAYDKLRADYDHETLLVDELKGECSELRQELGALCEDFDYLRSSSDARERDDRDRFDRLLDAYYALRDDYEDVQRAACTRAAPRIESSLRTNYDRCSASDGVPGLGMALGKSCSGQGLGALFFGSVSTKLRSK